MNSLFPYARIELDCDQALCDGHEINGADDAILLLTKYLFPYAVENSCVLYCDSNGLPLCVALLGAGNRENCTFDPVQISQIGLLLTHLRSQIGFIECIQGTEEGVLWAEEWFTC